MENEQTQDGARALRTAVKPAEVAWLRSKRRLATTDQEREAIAREISELAVAIDNRDKPLGRGANIGLAVVMVILGIVLGAVLLVAADAFTTYLVSNE